MTIKKLRIRIFFLLFPVSLQMWWWEIRQLKNHASKKHSAYFLLVMICVVPCVIYDFEVRDYSECAAYMILAVLLIYLCAVNFVLARREEVKINRSRTHAQIIGIMLRKGGCFGGYTQRAAMLRFLKSEQGGEGEIE